MKKNYIYILSSVVLVLLLSSSAMAQDDHLVVPTLTPWGALLTAVALGISGYIILKRRK
jgi:hypothetical protein